MLITIINIINMKKSIMRHNLMQIIFIDENLSQLLRPKWKEIN